MNRLMNDEMMNRPDPTWIDPTVTLFDNLPMIPMMPNQLATIIHGYFDLSNES